MPVPNEAKSQDNVQRNGSANEYTRESCESFWVEGVHDAIAFHAALGNSNRRTPANTLI